MYIFTRKLKYIESDKSTENFWNLFIEFRTNRIKLYDGDHFSLFWINEKISYIFLTDGSIKKKRETLTLSYPFVTRQYS